MKKLLSAACAALMLASAVAAPASAIAITTGDSFSATTKPTGWVTDRFEPAEFDRSDGYLYLTVGKNGFTQNRPADQKTAFYALQGRKLPTAKTSSNTWTATVKVKLDSNWFGNANRRVEFRVDLMDGKGTALEQSPAVALVNAGSASYASIASPKSTTGWYKITTYVNGDDEKEALDISSSPKDDGWHTLLIKATKGLITYHLDDKKLGSFPITERDVYPTAMAIGAQNYNTQYMTTWDNCYLYDGSYIIRQLSSSAQDKRDDRMESQYEKKRDNWEDKYTEFLVYQVASNSGSEKSREGWFTRKELNKTFGQDFDTIDDVETSFSHNGKEYIITEDELKKDMPDSYWDY